MIETFHTLPKSAGFYWWRLSADYEWRMILVIDHTAGFPGAFPHLAAYDVEQGTFGGRTLRQWAEHFPIGEWSECQKPHADAILRDVELLNASDALAVAVVEFLNDWYKGDFSLPRLAQHDAKVMEEKCETLLSVLKKGKAKP